MTITTCQVSRPRTLKKLYSDFSTPHHTKYRVDLEKEAPVLQRQLESLTEQERQRYETTFVQHLNSLSPAVRQSILGGAAGGAFGAGLALTTVSIKEIGRLLGGPVGFIFGLTVMGVATGAVTPVALRYFNQSNVKFSAKTPGLWNVVLPQASLEFEGASSKKRKAKQP